MRKGDDIVSSVQFNTSFSHRGFETQSQRIIKVNVSPQSRQRTYLCKKLCFEKRPSLIDLTLMYSSYHPTLVFVGHYTCFILKKKKKAIFKICTMYMYVLKALGYVQHIKMYKYYLQSRNKSKTWWNNRCSSKGSPAVCFGLSCPQLPRPQLLRPAVPQYSRPPPPPLQLAVPQRRICITFAKKIQQVRCVVADT